jgi:creatinine amidohydrolase/Fe(II)-dependent formamide hydrolase-like protein
VPASRAEPSWRAGYDLLQARVRGASDLLRREVPAVELSPDAVPGAEGGFVVTGVGSSAAHASYLVHLLGAGLGLRARYLPLSAFLASPAPARRRDVLVVISQGLSPNARLALAHPACWRHVVLMTAAHGETAPAAASPEKAALLAALGAAGVEIRSFPAGAEEDGTLVRVVGPLAGYLCALHLVAALARRLDRPVPFAEGDLDQVPARIEEAPARVAALGLPEAMEWLAGALVFLTAGAYGALVDNLRYKVLEGMLLPLPPVWDLLHVAHGPFQALCDRPATLLALTHRGAVQEDALLDRLGGMLDRERHRLIRLEAALSGPLAIFEHEAMMNELLLRFIAARAIDQVRWPGRGREEALYGLGRDVAPPPPSVAGAGGPRPTPSTGPVTGEQAPCAAGPLPAGDGRLGGERSPRAAAAPGTASPVRLETLVWPEVEELLARGPRTAVLALGATEQHGPHLPFATDTWVAEALAAQFCARVEEAIQLPVQAIGCSSEHMAFPGTLDLRASTLRAMLVDVAASLRRHGFACAFIFSAHGGNYEALRVALPDVRTAGAPMQVIAFTDLETLTARLHALSASFGVPAEAAGHHAGELETSLMAALRPESVRRERLACGLVDSRTDAQDLFYPSLRSRAPDGTVGDPSLAAPARAVPYLEAWVELLIEAYRCERNSPYASGT